MAGQPYLSVALQEVDITALVVHAEVEDNDRLIDRATVVLEDRNGETAAAAREGQTMEIVMGTTDEHAVVFSGDIFRVGLEGHTDGRVRARLTALDPSCRLMQSPPKVKDHVGSLSDILAAIVLPYGIPVGQIVPEPDRNFTEDQPLRQVQRRDWEFLLDLAQRFGARAFVEYNEGAFKFYWVPESRLLSQDPMGELSYQPGGSLIAFQWRRAAARAAPRQAVATADPLTGDLVSAPEPPPGAPETAASPITGATRTPDTIRPVSFAAGLPPVADPSVYLPPPDATLRLGLLGEGVTAANIHLRAKGTMTISGVQGLPEWAARDWYVHKVTHFFHRGEPLPPVPGSGSAQPSAAPDNRSQSRFVVTQ